MGIIEVNADLKASTKQLKRIADALTLIVERTYNVHLDHIAVPDANPSEEPSVAYTTDESEWKHNLYDLQKGLDPERVVDIDDPEDPDSVYDSLRKPR